jgi:hypothetical protein
MHGLPPSLIAPIIVPSLATNWGSFEMPTHGYHSSAARMPLGYDRVVGKFCESLPVWRRPEPSALLVTHCMGNMMLSDGAGTVKRTGTPHKLQIG